MLRHLGPLFVLLTLSDTIAAIIGARALWPLRSSLRFVAFVVALLTCIAIDQACQFVAFTGIPPGSRLGPWFRGWWWAGRIVHCAGIWALVLYLIGSHRKQQE